MTELSTTEPDSEISSPLSEEDIEPFFNEEDLRYGPDATIKVRMYAARYVRARQIGGHLVRLGSVEGNLKGRDLRFEFERMKLQPLHEFLLGELAATGFSMSDLFLEPNDTPPGRSRKF